MANEDTKNFNAMLHDSKDMPKQFSTHRFICQFLFGDFC